MNHKFKFTCIASALYVITNAQTVPYWKLGGNPNPPVIDGVNTTNNYLGTNATNNTFLKIGVQYSQDIMIDNDNSKLLPADGSGRLHGGHWIVELQEKSGQKFVSIRPHFLGCYY